MWESYYLVKWGVAEERFLVAGISAWEDGPISSNAGSLGNNSLVGRFLSGIGFSTGTLSRERVQRAHYSVEYQVNANRFSLLLPSIYVC